MKKSDLKKLIRESITSETQLNEIQNCQCTAKNELGIYNIYYGGPDTPCGGPVVPFGHSACCGASHMGNVSTAWVDSQPCLNWYGVGGGGQLPGPGKIPGVEAQNTVVTTGVGVKPGDINRLKDPAMKQGRLREEKDKKKLKDIILKTLEKEGGAAGIKALAKAAKTSKGKLKKDLDDMSGVKQHQDGDYISTPINERETAPASMAFDGPGCTCKCPAGYGTPTMGFSTFGLGGGYYTAEECQSACSGALCYELEGGTTTTSTPGLGKGDLGIEPVKRPSKPVKKPAFRRPERSKKPMRLREVKEIIKVMLDKKKKKK